MSEFDFVKDALSQEGVLSEQPQVQQVVSESEPVVSEPQVQPTETQIESEPQGEIQGTVEDINTEPQVELVKQEEPVVDKTNYLEEISGGRIKSQEDLEQLYQEREELMQKLESESYRTEYARQIDNWVEAGYDPELFHIIQSLPVDQLDDNEAIKADYKLQYPELTEDDIDTLITDEYRQGDEFTDSQRAAGLIRMRQAAERARQSLYDLKQQTEVVDVRSQRESVRQEEVQRVESWSRDIPQVVNTFDKITVAAGDKDNYNYIPSTEQKRILQAELDNIVRQVNIPYDEQGKAAMKQITEDTFFRLFKNEITKAVAVAAQSRANEKISKEIHNPSGALRTELPTKKAEYKTEDDVAADLAKYYGIR
jgi:hypothetical protein